MKFNSIYAAGFAATLFVSCGTTDTEPPSVCSDVANLSGVSSVLMDEIDADAGSTVTVTDSFCDDSALGEVRWDLHSAEGHAHEEGEEEEFTLNSGTDWSELEVRALEGSAAEETFTFDVPVTARGVWDLVVSVVDAEGNAAPDVIVQVHVENDHIPAFHLGEVGGMNPAEWEGEPVWSPGSLVGVSGLVTDSDGLAEAALSLIRESDETVVWAADLSANGDTALVFAVDVEVPADAEGEYHFEMEAADLSGVEMHTGFHVEIE
jgi:hypothetical protein